jgi:hypothetical protein
MVKGAIGAEGFALRPRAIAHNLEYSQKASLAALADPCRSCQWLFHQLQRNITPELMRAQDRGKEVNGDVRQWTEWKPRFSIDRVRDVVLGSPDTPTQGVSTQSAEPQIHPAVRAAASAVGILVRQNPSAAVSVATHLVLNVAASALNTPARPA